MVLLATVGLAAFILWQHRFCKKYFPWKWVVLYIYMLIQTPYIWKTKIARSSSTGFWVYFETGSLKAIRSVWRNVYTYVQPWTRPYFLQYSNFPCHKESHWYLEDESIYLYHWKPVFQQKNLSFNRISSSLKEVVVGILCQVTQVT